MSDLPPGLQDQINSIFGGQVLPPLGQYIQGQGLVTPELAQIISQTGLTGLEAQQAYGNTLAQLGIEKGALARQQAAAPQEYAISKEGLALDQGSLDLQRQQEALRGKSLDLTQTQEQQAADIARRGAWSGATARGATNTSGFSQGLTDINQNLANQLAQLALSRQGLGLQGQGLDIQGQRLGLSNMQTDINYGLQQGSLADQLAQLNLNYGIAGQTLANSGTQAGINAANAGLGIIQNAQNASQAGVNQVTTAAGQTAGINSANPDIPPSPLLPGRT